MNTFGFVNVKERRELNFYFAIFQHAPSISKKNQKPGRLPERPKCEISPPQGPPL